MKKHTSLVPYEAEEDRLLFDWSEVHSLVVPELGFLYHIPNETAWKLGKSQGVRSGVSDWHLPVPARGFIGCWIEMKRQKGGKTSTAQNKWLEDMQGFGHYAVVCRGGEEAIKVLMWYLGIPNPR
jgi:VRR-NUC domain